MDSTAAPAPAPVPVPVEAAPAPAKKRIVLALPGKTFSDHFMISLVRSLYVLWESNRFEVIISPAYSSYVSFARCKTLGGSVMRGKDQLPFMNDQGQVLNYDLWVTIDSDIVWRPEDLMALIEAVTPERPVVSGYYLMSDLTHTTVCKDEDNEYFLANGTYKFLTPQELQDWSAVTGSTFMPVFYNGMGFMAISSEVLRNPALKYPWFHSDLVTIQAPDGRVLVDQSSEDVSFAKNLAAAGYTIQVHTGLRVGHEKPIII